LRRALASNNQANAPSGGIGFYRLRDSSLQLFVRVSPGAKRDGITGVRKGGEGETRLNVKVAAPPDKGRANTAVISLLAKKLDTPKSTFAVASGATSRLKTIEIKGATESLCARLDVLAATPDDKS
jgi:uncharacterized protein (TIGR00251 family)